MWELRYQVGDLGQQPLGDSFIRAPAAAEDVDAG
jgi:hypothetical protein